MGSGKELVDLNGIRESSCELCWHVDQFRRDSSEEVQAVLTSFMTQAGTERGDADNGNRLIRSDMNGARSCGQW